MLRFISANVVATIVFCMLLASTAMAEQDDRRFVSVSGEGKVKIPATFVDVQAGVETNAKTAQEAQKQAALKANGIVTFLKKNNALRLQTTSITVNPQYHYNQEGKPPQVVGFTATNSVSARFTIPQAGVVVDGVVEAGATRLDSVSFGADDEKIAAARQEALSKAVDDALLQANAALRPLNEKVKEVVGLQIGGASVGAPPPYPMPMMEKAMMVADGAAPSPVLAREQEVMATVTLKALY
jgi:uncharacterized protein